MEFSAILSAVYDDLGYQASPAADVVTRIKRYVNEGLTAVLAEPAIFGLIEADTPYTFPSVVNQAQYSVPDAHAYIRHITEQTNDRHLVGMTLSDYRRNDPDPAAHTGTPSHWVPLGRVAVAIQPSDASDIFLKSSAAGDTGAAYIEGIVTGGNKRSVTVTLTGITAVASGVNSWIEITDVYMAAAAVGNVSILEDSGSGTLLGTIPIGLKRPNYQGFYLWPTPAGVWTYTVDTRRELESLVQDADEPPLPRDFHPMLVAYARFREWTRKDDTRASEARQEFELWLSRLKYRVAQMGDTIHVSRSRRPVGISRLGGYFPVDTVVW